MSQEGASYRAAGVDYDALDAGKRLAMAKALSTSPLLEGRGGRALDASRGEPAFVFELGSQTFAFVVEGLGTKSIIARNVLEGQGIDRFADVAYDTVAAILNDLCCVGALPLVVNAYFATGASEWYLQRERSVSLLEGWRRACADAGCVWGGGRRTRPSTWARAMPSTAAAAAASGSSRSLTGLASPRWSAGALRRDPGRSSWSRWACASPGTGSSCRRAGVVSSVNLKLRVTVRATHGIRDLRGRRFSLSTTRPNRQNLNASSETAKVWARSSPLFPCEGAGDLDVAGPAWLRSYPDRGGPVHQKRERT